MFSYAQKQKSEEIAPEDKPAFAKNAVLIYRVLNTIKGKRLDSVVKQKWSHHFEDNAKAKLNIEVIQAKIANSFQTQLGHHRDNVDQALKYLDYVCGVKGVKIKASEKKGQVFALDHQQASDMLLFHHEHLCRTFAHEWQIGSFTIGILLNEAINYMAARYGVENKFPQIVQSLFDNLVQTKPITFFQRGYNTDLLVVDAMCEVKGSLSKGSLWRCAKEYLSTGILDNDHKPLKGDLDYYDYQTIAA